MSMYLYMTQCVDMYWSLAKSYGLEMDAEELRAWRKKNQQRGSRLTVDEVLFEVNTTDEMCVAASSVAD